MFKIEVRNPKRKVLPKKMKKNKNSHGLEIEFILEVRHLYLGTEIGGPQISGKKKYNLKINLQVTIIIFF
jgi:hypothetical protein